MTDVNSFAPIMERLRCGEEDAASEVFRLFSGRLLALVRRQIQQRLAHRVDAEEVVQSAFKSFFLRHRDGRLQVDDREGLWGLLTLIALRKCADRFEYLRAGCRDVGREVFASNEEAQPWQLALDREPSPEEAALFTETVDELFRMTEPDEVPVLELCLQGYTSQEISLQLGRALRSVQRLRERFRKRLERMQRED